MVVVLVTTWCIRMRRAFLLVQSWLASSCRRLPLISSSSIDQAGTTIKMFTNNSDILNYSYSRCIDYIDDLGHGGCTGATCSTTPSRHVIFRITLRSMNHNLLHIDKPDMKLKIGLPFK